MILPGVCLAHLAGLENLQLPLDNRAGFDWGLSITLLDPFLHSSESPNCFFTTNQGS